jgi:hypothetical protein
MWISLVGSIMSGGVVGTLMAHAGLRWPWIVACTLTLTLANGLIAFGAAHV